MVNISNFENQLKDLNKKVKHKLNELRNLYRENCCLKDFIKNEKLIEDYEKWRVEYFQRHKWNK